MFGKPKIPENARERIGADEIQFRDSFNTRNDEPEAAFAPQPTAQIPAEPETGKKLQLKVVNPESFGEAGDIADLLLDGNAVIANIERLERPEVIRLLDFLNGVTYTFDGEIRQISQTTFVITPHNVDIGDVI